MHTAQLLAQAIDAARRLGFDVREDVLDGAGGGHCLIRGKKWLMIDVTQSYREQLSDVIDAIQTEPELGSIELHPALAERVKPQRSAA